MRVGTQQLIYKVENILYENHVPSRRRVAKEIVEAIINLIGDDMSNRDWNLYHGFPEELESVVKKLQNGLGQRMKRDEDAIAVYRWLSEQGDDKIKHFIKWATAEERVQYVGKYRNSPEAIKIDWKIAFKETSPAVMRNADGSLNV